MAQSAPAALPILELDVMKTFIAIAETGNFTTAAEAVFRTPSAVSMQIKKLEETLGVPLFRRDARSVSLTHHGEMLLSFAKRLIALNNEAVSRFVVPEMNGIVKLGAPDDIGELVLPGILSHLSETWPQLAIDVTIESSANLHRALLPVPYIGGFGTQHRSSREEARIAAQRTCAVRHDDTRDLGDSELDALRCVSAGISIALGCLGIRHPQKVRRRTRVLFPLDSAVHFIR